MIQPNKNMRRPGIEPGSTAWKAAMLTIIPPTPHIALGFYLDYSREQFVSKCVLEFLQVWINCWSGVLSWGYSSVVEQSAAVRQVHGSNPCVPYKNFSSNICMFFVSNMDVQRESDSSRAVYKCKIVFNENLYTRLQITLSITYARGSTQTAKIVQTMCF